MSSWQSFYKFENVGDTRNEQELADLQAAPPSYSTLPTPPPSPFKQQQDQERLGSSYGHSGQWTTASNQRVIGAIALAIIVGSVIAVVTYFVMRGKHFDGRHVYA